jgi:hypothetical protein
MRAALVALACVSSAYAATWHLIDSDIATTDAGSTMHTPSSPPPPQWRCRIEPLGSTWASVECNFMFVSPVANTISHGIPPHSGIPVPHAPSSPAGVAFVSDTVGYSAASTNGGGPEILKTTNGVCFPSPCYVSCQNCHGTGAAAHLPPTAPFAPFAPPPPTPGPPPFQHGLWPTLLACLSLPALVVVPRPPRAAPPPPCARGSCLSWTSPPTQGQHPPRCPPLFTH